LKWFFLSKLGIRFIFRTDIPDNIDRFAPSGHCLGEARQLVLFQTEFSSLGVEAHDSLHPSAAATTARPWQRPPACFSQQCRHGWGKSNEVFGERNVIRLPRSMMARGTSCALISWLKSESLGNSWNCRSSTDWVHNVKMKMKFRNGASLKCSLAYTWYTAMWFRWCKHGKFMNLELIFDSMLVN
jgi:hypothetical protein